jgi:hypothetical protein
MARGNDAETKGPALRVQARWWGIALAGLMGVPAVATAAEAPHGFTVSPAYQEVAVPGQGNVEFAISITNNTVADQNFALTVQDFGSLDESGGVAFLGTPTSELEHKYGLASWLSLDHNTVFIAHGQSAQLVARVENRQSLGPGGHYGAVLATAVDDLGRPIKDPRVGVQQVLASLVLAVKEGGVVRELKQVGQSSDGGWWRLPSQVEERFRNSGNVHLIPRGLVMVKDSVGRIVSSGALNENSDAVLPGSYRRYETSLVNVGRAWLPGRYQIVTSYHSDGANGEQRFTTWFWYSGDLVVVSIGILAIAAAAGLAWWLWWRPRRRRRKRQTGA